jgi:sterol desaturase/sphingolipid hydroxylase (fatty acid hydroxylase superfamily)
MLFLLQVAFFGFIEARWGARRIDWRKVLLADLIALAFCSFIVRDAANYLNGWTRVYGPWPASTGAWPLPVRLVLYLVVADFFAYWMHRLVHLKPLWRVHRWHHAPTYMYWLAGSRGSILQQTLFNLPYIFASPLLGVSPWWVANGLLLFYAATNAWMHMNVKWRLRGLDLLLVTPQSHHIHHSAEPSHYNSNFGVVLSVWDRLFGTFTSPHATDPAALKFGIGERVPIARLAVGL